MSPDTFVDEISHVRFPNVFNPWSEVCAVADHKDAAAVRRQNLALVLDRAVTLRVDTVLIGRDLGYRGGRRTGLALTDEANLPTLSRMYGGGLALKRATQGPMVAERTAAMFWEIVERLQAPIFTWNVFPFHPFEPGKPLSNRSHTRSERRLCRPIIIRLLEMLRPSRVVAIGNDAELGLRELGISCVKVRHPSYGGKADFVAGMTSLHPHLSVQPDHATPELPFH